MEIDSPVDGSVVFQLFEPVEVVPGERYPLILEGHGSGGSRQTEPSGLTTNTFPDAGLDFFRYHSPRYFCEGEVIESIDFAIGSEIPQTPPIAPPPVDVTIWQGFKHTLFNVTEAIDNYDCFCARGGDVRLLTHQSGHILPLSLSVLGDEVDAALYALSGLVAVPEFQGPGGANACGGISRSLVTIV